MLTTAEVALVAAAIPAAGGWLVAVAVSKGSRRGEHEARLWERRAEVYEYVLSRVAWWTELRSETRRAVTRGDVTVDSPVGVAFEEDHRRMRARLDLFGEARVREAYERAADAGKELLLAFMDYRQCRIDNQHARDGGALPGDVDPEPLRSARGKLVELDQMAGDLERELVVEARAAIERLPRYEHRRGPQFRWK